MNDNEFRFISVLGWKISTTTPGLVKFFNLLKEKCYEYNIQNPIDYNVMVYVSHDHTNWHTIYGVQFGQIGQTKVRFDYDEDDDKWEVTYPYIFDNPEYKELFGNLTYVDAVRLFIFQILMK